MEFRIYDSAIALTANDSTDLLHLCRYVDLSSGGSVILATMFLGNVAECARRTEVRDGRAFNVVEDVVGNGYQSVFLSVHLAVFLNECQTVYIRVYHDA